ncbi:MAG: hypothetical protein A2538_00985 [Candidatus Magasanikbacteria bacterium RIFOXYD2_FULL_41_14]|uniref:Phage holin family protein n=1 Tax=Candidatus Magasanikbacteria bacterium RIFOXYD2_FULL_41_14 TaxID=1798709 RepID=A0A1F6PEJ3_9BACT|nr:MAG: hypothetical protein A2538_00985 [Candidatus Magasanikbacteria bacterium RIFOXYD2_FULL_41_14]
MKLLLRWFINAAAIIIIASYLPGLAVSGFYAALVTALILGLVNALIRPVVLFFTLPVNILTLGLFTFVVNALMLWLVSSIVKGFYVAGFASAFWAALILWLVSWFTNVLLKKNR